MKYCRGEKDSKLGSSRFDRRGLHRKLLTGSGSLVRPTLRIAGKVHRLQSPQFDESAVINRLGSDPIPRGLKGGLSKVVTDTVAPLVPSFRSDSVPRPEENLGVGQVEIGEEPLEVLIQSVFI